MLHLDKIQLTQFKNYNSSSFEFSARVTGICGNNGMGKTNLLDAIYYICFTKSYFSKSESLNVGFGFDGFRLEANICQIGNDQVKEQHFNVISTLKPGNKKEIFLNSVPYEKFSHHLGKFPCVMIAPDDVELISGNSDGRRKFIDTVLSQTDAEYLQQLIIYNKVLQQRNSLLKNFNDSGKKDFPLLDVLDMQLISPAEFIYNKRKEFTQKLVPLSREFYCHITKNDENIEIKYESQLHENSIEQLLKLNREKDCILLRTNAGIHKDDLLTNLNKRPFKHFGSQGQKKSLLFSLKLAEYELLKNSKGFAPFLLLDDVFEKLDEERMNNLLEWVCVHNQGQVFITDTHKVRLSATLNKLGISPYILELS